ncbi:MAG: hypothetical protein KF850_38865 [Labilithrix sp.]|nr:hypothetical protein [Labilithrix sp.]MBX3218033.1 hypothetical protein [Labilithrix sp.]
MLQACQGAPLFRAPRGWGSAELTRERPRVVVRVLVPDEPDVTKGEGEVGVSGASRAFGVRVVDMASKTTVQEGQVIGRCFENVVRPGAGERCVVFEYDGDDRGRPLRFEYDFASRMHYQATETTYERGAADAVCPSR